MARKKKSKDGGLRGDEWMNTYADTVTLLLTFFVLLYSMSSVDAEKTKNIATAFKSLMNVNGGDSILEYNLNDGDAPLIGGENTTAIDGGTDLVTQEQLYNKIKEFVTRNNLEGVVEIINDERGVAIELRDNILFETSSSDLKEESKEVLDKISTIISSMVNPILIEGHTDNRPINTAEFPSNWELSSDRAINVVRYFVEVKGQDPKRFSAIGYGEFQPIADNSTNEGMSKNRRVEILIVTSEEEGN